MSSPPRGPDPRKVAVGKANRAKRKGLTPAGAEALRQAALKNRPWMFATGPRTPEGKARSAANAKVLQKGPESVRAARREAAEILTMCAALVRARAAMGAGKRL